MNKLAHAPMTSPGWWLTAVCAATLLTGCGGGAKDSAAPENADVILLPEAVASQVAQPGFHLAPVILDAPDDLDAANPEASARLQPRVQALPADTAALPTRRLTLQAIGNAKRERALSANTASPAAASTSNVTVYTPAQIRAAYALPALPVPGTTPNAEQAAQLGAGQTIYIVAAKHDPNIEAELAAFNLKFGLPGCRTQPIGTSLPLAVASKTEGCVLSIAYSTPAGGLSSTAPTYDASWATEIALDVQWAHAIAPLARIVLIEAASAELSQLSGAIKLANAMGPGVVSMSFGAPEGSWTAGADTVFGAGNMSYLAATGDSGAGVMWPSVAANVLAVGGTRLNYSTTGRAEAGWSSTGGGVSAYTATPAYQSGGVPVIGSLPRRAVADVAFNADPTTGQYLAVMVPGSTQVNWVSGGGTSLATPQWAGLLAVANAMRLQSGKTAFSTPHALLYGQIGAVKDSYAKVFNDISSGSNGSCDLCTAKTGFDGLTGLGSPVGSGLLGALSGASTTAAAPTVKAGSIKAVVGTPLTFTVGVTAPNPVSYSLSGAPAGMVISNNGVVNWPKP
ncbi:MAG: hypothetical protein RJA44_1582, partial [Pseudomonadota bacterium]